MALATEGPSGLGSMVFATGLTGTDTITPILLGTGWPIGMPADIIMLTVMDIATDTPTGLSMLPGLRITVMPMHPTGSITYGMGTDTPTGLSIYLGMPIIVMPMHPTGSITYGMDKDTPTGLSMYLGMPIMVMPMHPTGSITYGMDKDTPAGLSIYLGRSITVTPMHHALHINCTMDMLTTLRTGMFPIMRRAIMPVCGPPCLIDIRHIPRIRGVHPAHTAKHHSVSHVKSRPKHVVVKTKAKPSKAAKKGKSRR